ncbi:MAG TPA: TetR/AcrR family transcriptional regulator [Terriglobales bacterium]
MKTKRISRPRGRPRTFDLDKALDCALEVFWRKGYEGASLSDLTRAMGINRPSLYAAFGDKETLFRKALDRYHTGPAAYVMEALNQPNARAVAERLLYGAADALACPRSPRGCLMVQGALACSDAAEPVRKELIAQREQGEAALRRRLQRAKAEGDLPANSSAADLAGFIMTVIHGMSIRAAAGASRAELHRIADTALRAWPK